MYRAFSTISKPDQGHRNSSVRVYPTIRLVGPYTVAIMTLMPVSQKQHRAFLQSALFDAQLEFIRGIGSMPEGEVSQCQYLKLGGSDTLGTHRAGARRAHVVSLGHKPEDRRCVLGSNFCRVVSSGRRYCAAGHSSSCLIAVSSRSILRKRGAVSAWPLASLESNSIN
jgi:hypothetical protein